MEYRRVAWHHDFALEPVALYSELDGDSVEVRRVEVFRDGHSTRADADHEYGSTRVSTQTAAIEDDAQFTVEVIEPGEFERVWADASPFDARGAAVVSEAHLTNLERLAADLAPEPWFSSRQGRDHLSGDDFVQVGAGRSRGDDTYVMRHTDRGLVADAAAQDFLAAARNAVPALVAELRRLRAARPDADA